MPKFRVLLEDESKENIDGIYNWLLEHSREGAERWYRAFHSALNELAEDAVRFPFAPETHRFDVSIRNAVFRTRNGSTYRILFTIDDGDVHVLFVRGPGQDAIGD